MAYITHGDIDARYPGELAQAGPRNSANALDETAIDMACRQGSDLIDRALRTIGWIVPLDDVPDWVVDLNIDLSLYLATPTTLASQSDFADRRDRYTAALRQLDDIAQGRQLPATTPDAASAGSGVFMSSSPSIFGRGDW